MVMKVIYQKYKQLLPLVILSVECIFLLWRAFIPSIDSDGFNSCIILTNKHHLAFISVVINFIFFFGYRPFYKYSLFATIVLGIFNVINFTSFSSSINFGSLHIGFSFTTLLLGFFTLAINYERFKVNPTDSYGKSFEEIPNTKNEIFNEEVEKFRSRFKNASTKELTQLMNDKRYTTTAIKAAQQIIEERIEIEKSH